MGLPRIESGLWAKTDQSFPPFNHLAIVYGAVTQYHEHTARLLRGRLQDDTTNDNVREPSSLCVRRRKSIMSAVSPMFTQLRK